MPNVMAHPAIGEVLDLEEAFVARFEEEEEEGWDADREETIACCEARIDEYRNKNKHQVLGIVLDRLLDKGLKLAIALSEAKAAAEALYPTSVKPEGA